MSAQKPNPTTDRLDKGQTPKLVRALLFLLIIVATIITVRESTSTLPSSESPLLYSPTSSVTPHPVLSDLRIREGIAYCVNRSELIHSVYPWLDDTGRFQASSFVPIGHWAYSQNGPRLASYSFDPSKGKSLFEEAGWRLTPGDTYRTNFRGEELRLTLTIAENASRKNWVAVFQRQMKDCGVHILLERVASEWLYGTGLKRGDFELAAYAWLSQSDPDGRTLYQCDQIPLAENNWQGDNYAGWCNLKADQAIRLVSSSFSRDIQQAGYRIVQEEYARDIPSLPLFNHVEIYASNVTLQNFVPDSTETLYTWNAGQWAIAGRDTIVIAQRSEPTSLSVLMDDAYITRLIGALIYGVEYTNLSYDYQPGMLKQIPTLKNGAVKVNTVHVKEGEEVIDINGSIVELRRGVHILDSQGNEIVFDGGAVEMNQLIVKYEFVDGITWSDGIPVSKDDYTLAYRILCQSNISTGMLQLPCKKILGVDFISDTVYIITWMPGYQGRARADFAGQPYFLPPIGRQPSHQIVSTGQSLANTPFSDWRWLDEINRRPLGTGPYIIDHWDFGKEIIFTPNPYYYGKNPATQTIILRFLTPEDAIDALRNGEVDIVDTDTVSLTYIESLLNMQIQQKVRLHFIPSIYYELLVFSLYSK